MAMAEASKIFDEQNGQGNVVRSIDPRGSWQPIDGHTELYSKQAKRCHCCWRDGDEGTYSFAFLFHIFTSAQMYLMSKMGGVGSGLMGLASKFL